MANAIASESTRQLQQAWSRYYASLETARLEIEASPHFAQEQHRAQGYYVLAEAQAMAYNWIIAPRLNHPRIFTHTAWISYLYGLPANCPDIIYSMLALDGRYSYRLKGRYGDLCLMLLQVFNGPMGIASTECTGNYEYTAQETGGDEFEIILSPEKQAGNWIPLDPASRFNVIIFRRFLPDWNADCGTLDIDTLDTVEDYDEASERDLAQRLDWAADFLLATLRNYAILLYEVMLNLTGQKINVWGNIPGEQMASVAGSSTCSYSFLPYDISEDEALLIELDAPVGSIYWSFQLFDVWSKSLDFTHAQTDFNMLNAAIDDDNKVRAVLSLSDPGVANWLDPLGRAQGACVFRNYRAKTYVEPACRLVKLGELHNYLPDCTETVTLAERRAIVAKRRPAQLGLYGGW